MPSCPARAGRVFSREPVWRNGAAGRVARVVQNDACTVGRIEDGGGLLYGTRYGAYTGWRPRALPGWVPPPRPVGSQLDAGLVGTGSGRSQITAGAAGQPALESPAVPTRPRRELLAGAPFLPGVGHPVPQKARRRDDRRDPREKARGSQASLPIRATTPTQGEGDEHADPRPTDRFRQRPGWRTGRLSGTLGGGRPGGDVGGDVSQVRIGPRDERKAHPRVQFVLGPPVLYERDLEQLDHPLAVRTGRP